MNSALRQRKAVVLIAALSAMLGNASAQQPLGTQPTYTSRALTPIPNADAVVARIWAPGLDDGYVPQGVTIVGNDLFVGAYLSTPRDSNRGPCRLYRVNASSGLTTGQLDLPPSCGHSGGVARGPDGRVFVADTRIVYEVTLEAVSNIGGVTHTTKLTDRLKGSFAAGTSEALWLGTYERDGPGALYRVPYAAMKQSTINERDATAHLELPGKTQGGGVRSGRPALDFSIWFDVRRTASS